jgi:hypothetical protein
MNPFIVIKNTKTNEETIVYREIYNSTIVMIDGYPATKKDNEVYACNEVFNHVVNMSNLINNCLKANEYKPK